MKADAIVYDATAMVMFADGKAADLQKMQYISAQEETIKITNLIKEITLKEVCT